MNRIARIATLTLAFAAAGSAFAESPVVSNYVLDASAVSTAPRATARVVGVTNDFTGYHAQPVVQGRSRADVVAETLAAVRSGELRAQGGEFALHAYGQGLPSARTLDAIGQ